MDRSGANEDTYPMLVISRLITVTYLPIYWNGKRLNPRTSTSFHVKFQFTALLLQSGINFGHLRLVQLHQNLPQYFRQNHVADSIFDFLEYFAEPCRRCIWIILSKPRRRSWTWKSFRRTSIIRRMHRYFLCFVSNLHVSGFSSCRII